MPVEKTLEDSEDIALVKRRFELMTAAEYRDRDRIRRASESIDKIRKKAGDSGESMTEIVREWREKRRDSSGS